MRKKKSRKGRKSFEFLHRLLNTTTRCHDHLPGLYQSSKGGPCSLIDMCLSRLSLRHRGPEAGVAAIKKTPWLRCPPRNAPSTGRAVKAPVLDREGFGEYRMSLRDSTSDPSPSHLVSTTCNWRVCGWAIFYDQYFQCSVTGFYREILALYLGTWNDSLLELKVLECPKSAGSTLHLSAYLPPRYSYST